MSAGYSTRQPRSPRLAAFLAASSWIATVIQTEADAPFKGAVDGVRQADPAIHVPMKPVANKTTPAAHVHRE